MGQVDEDSESIQFFDGIKSEIAQAVVVALVAAVAHQIALVVGYLNDANAQSVKQFESIEVISDGRSVLPPDHHARLAFLFCLKNILRGRGLGDQVFVLSKPRHPAGDVVHRFREAFPDGYCGVYASHATAFQTLVNCWTVPIADVQSVDNHGVLMDILAELSHVLLALFDEIGDVFADHHGGHVGVGADAIGHDRGVNDSQSFHAMDFAILVNHGHRV